MIHLFKWAATGLGIVCSFPLIAFGAVCSIVAWDSKYFDHVNECVFNVIGDL